MKILKFLTIALFPFVISCDPVNEYDPNEVVVSIDATNWEMSPLWQKTFIVVENKASEAKYIELKEGMDTVIRRGDEIVGDKVGVHFVNISASNCNIISYLSIPIGYAITFPGGKGVVKDPSVRNDTKAMVEVTTAAIPVEFNVITRAAMMQSHGHTFKTTEDISTICTRTFDTRYGSQFYVCLQNETSAAYELVTIPEVGSYEVAFDNLNYNMTRYQFPKIPGYNISLICKAYGNVGSFSIYRVDDENIFEGDHLNLFVPDEISQMTSFYISMNKSPEQYNGRGWNTTAVVSQLSTDISFLDAGLSLSHTSGSFPKVSSANNDFSYLNMNLQKESETMDYSWDIFSPVAKDFYNPSFPSEVLEAIEEGFGIDYLLENPSGLKVTAVKDSHLETYTDILDRNISGTVFSATDYFTELTESMRVGTLK